MGVLPPGDKSLCEGLTMHPGHKGRPSWAHPVPWEEWGRPLSQSRRRVSSGMEGAPPGGWEVAWTQPAAAEPARASSSQRLGGKGSVKTSGWRLKAGASARASPPPACRASPGPLPSGQLCPHPQAPSPPPWEDQPPALLDQHPGTPSRQSTPSGRPGRLARTQAHSPAGARATLCPSGHPALG